MCYEMHVHSSSYIYDRSNAHKNRNKCAYTTGASFEYKLLTGLYDRSCNHEKKAKKSLSVYTTETHLCIISYEYDCWF